MAQFAVGASIFPTNNDVFNASASIGRGRALTEEGLRVSLARAASARTRAFVVSGFAPPATGTSLSFSYNSGKAIIDGYLIDAPFGTTITLQASRSNYVYLRLIKNAGLVTNAVIEVLDTATGSAVEDPIIPPDCVLICRLTTDGSQVTAVRDFKPFLGRLVWGVIEQATGPVYRTQESGSSDWHVARTTGLVTFINPLPTAGASFTPYVYLSSGTAASITASGFDYTGAGNGDALFVASVGRFYVPGAPALTEFS